MSATRSLPSPADGRDRHVRADTAYRIRDLDPTSESEVDTVTRMCMTTVLDTVPEFEHDEERARRSLPNFTFERMRDMIRADLSRPTHRFLVAIDADGRVVGHSMISRKTTPEGRRFGYFFSRYVEPEHRKKGVAARLLEEALAWFGGYDWDYLLAHTHSSNEPLRRLFERHGFRVAERHDEPWPSLTLRLDRHRLG
jgi:ribosomal protein S18 acetylase RimI-like enzyme